MIPRFLLTAPSVAQNMNIGAMCGRKGVKKSHADANASCAEDEEDGDALL